MNLDHRITEKGRLWYIEPHYDPGRAIEIYQAIKDLPISSALDIGCGQGLILESLSWVLPFRCKQFDLVSYPEWEYLKERPFTADVMEFIKKDEPYDLVLFLNSYRNWDEEPREQFNQWLRRNAKYFVTSGEEGPSSDYKIIGKDVKGHDLKLYTL